MELNELARVSWYVIEAFEGEVTTLSQLDKVEANKFTIVTNFLLFDCTRKILFTIFSLIIYKSFYYIFLYVSHLNNFQFIFLNIFL